MLLDKKYQIAMQNVDTILFYAMIINGQGTNPIIAFTFRFYCPMGS